MVTTKLRCRAAGPSSNIWARQCRFAAKTERRIGGPDVPALPVCGVHANARYVYEYRPSPDSKYERPVEEEA